MTRRENVINYKFWTKTYAIIECIETWQRTLNGGRAA